MKDANREYENALAAFAEPGCRWEQKGQLVYWGKASGRTEEDVIADARSVGVTNRDADIRRGWRDISPRGAVSAKSTCRRVERPVPRKYQRHVRDLVGENANGTIDWVRELSPTWEWIDREPLLQTELFLLAVCAPKDILHVFRKDAPSAGVLGVNLRSAEDWVKDVAHASAWGDLIVPNPFSGREGETSEGKKSLIAQSCLASYPYLVLEMDDMPLPMQYAFWRNFILTSKLSDSLVSVVHSGNRSLHGLLYVGCQTLLEWQAVRNSIRELFASDDEPMYRADAQAMCPRTGTRLPGIRRGDNGILQELVYLNPNVRENNMCFRGQCHGSSLRL